MMTETSLSKTEPDVIVGTPICRRTSFILDKFLSNQQEIQQAYPGCRLVLATDEPDFVAGLKEQINHYHLKGEVITYETVKPDYAQSRDWSMVSGREAIRQHVLSQTTAEYFLSVDADMTFNPHVIQIMETEIKGYDVAHSAYPLRRFGINAAGLGCSMITRDTLEIIEFRCLEFKNGQLIPEGNLLDIDLFNLGKRIKRGFFLHISHYETGNKAKYISPQPLGLLKKITNLLLVRYVLIKASIMLRYDIPGKLQTILYGSIFNRRS
ncbi:hypothetical protein ACFLXT_01355 [Chloroflexota bacterium]